MRGDTPDTTLISSSVQIGEDSAGIEDTLVNNTDDTTTNTYKADLVILKDGISDNNADGSYSSGDSSTTTALGKNIRYTISYDNIGNTFADNAVINEKIPNNTCFTIGSIANIQTGMVVEYSDTNGSSYSYTPLGAIGTQDCAVTHFRVRFTNPLPAPAHFTIDGLASTRI